MYEEHKKVPDPQQVRVGGPQTLTPSFWDETLGVRRTTETLCEGLTEGEMGLQAAPFVSPPKWHLAHTTWFFENFILLPGSPNYRVFDPEFSFLFNSYYRSQGAFHGRGQRGMLGRPTLSQVMQYRRYVEAHLEEFLGQVQSKEAAHWVGLLQLGVNHEQQHQELLLADTKFNLFQNPLRPAWKSLPSATGPRPRAMGWVEFPEGLRTIGAGVGGFSYDNEGPQHGEFLAPFQLGSRLVTNEEFLQFMEDGGYSDPRWWLDDGWTEKEREQWTAPLYWERGERDWQVFGLGGMETLDPHAPVGHVSYYEADAYATWVGRRLPREGEWETACQGLLSRGVFLEEESFRPLPLDERRSVGMDGEYEVGLHQLFGDLWEWTNSAYLPYPGFRRDPDSPLGEYNGKFMINQMVLRGGSCATPQKHVRPTYRNFLHPQMRWYFSGVRLADS